LLKKAAKLQADKALPADEVVQELEELGTAVGAEAFGEAVFVRLDEAAPVFQAGLAFGGEVEGLGAAVFFG
jgi:hypothetical protein